MNRQMPLTEQQQDLVAANMDIVKWVIYRHITVNEHIFGFSRDDLHQEGCLYLCLAARTHDESKSQFHTYAQVVVKNGLISYCRRMCAIQKKQLYLADVDACSDNDTDCQRAYQFSEPDALEPHMARMFTLSALETAKEGMSGVALLGVEALELKIKGYSGSEIAQMYGVKRNHVGAWISRASQKLRQNEVFMTSLL